MSPGLFTGLFLLSLLGAVFFAGSETGMLAADTLFLRMRAEKGSKNARSVLKLLEKKDVLLATMLVGNNLAIVSASAVTTSFFTQRYGQNGALISIAVVSPMLLTFGEILPKAVYLSFGERLLMATHWLVTFFAIIFRPIVLIAMALPRMIARSHRVIDAGVTRQDIEVLVKTSVLAGDLAREERQMISRLLDLKARRVTHAMVPLIDVAMISDTAKIRDAHRVIRSHGVSRLPVYSGSQDHITGVVFATDLLRSTDPLEPVTTYCRKPFFVPEQKTIIELFDEVYQKRDLAIVIDEYGVATGIITIEDMIEEVIGEVQDEYDDETELYQPLATGGLLIDSRISVFEFNEVFGPVIPPGDYETVAGFLMMVMQRVPGRGEKVVFNNTGFTVLDASARRVGRVVVTEVKTGKER